ncbi:MAG: hypothetical protein JSU87_12080 [Gemmatimonadota bacterium]|nr:MAG: hypothetical protein JSU87_12080 [Gemmatimonadota bacterium]
MTRKDSPGETARKQRVGLADGRPGTTLSVVDTIDLKRVAILGATRTRDPRTGPARSLLRRPVQDPEIPALKDVLPLHERAAILQTTRIRDLPGAILITAYQEAIRKTCAWLADSEADRVRNHVRSR